MRFLSIALALLWSCTAIADVHKFLARGEAVQAGTEAAPLKARLYAIHESTYQSVLFLNPGGLIPALAMSGLAEGFAQKGHLVFVLDNPNDLPVQAITLAPDWAAVFKKNHQLIQGMPDELKIKSLGNLPLRVFGHSLGGAVLGSEIGNDATLFQEIVLMGVSRLVATPERPSTKVRLLLGEKDGLASRSSVDQLAARFNTQTIIVPGVNHFCIISDPNVGAPDKKAQDLPTDLSREECMTRVVAVVEGTWR